MRKPLIVICTKGLVSAALTKLAVSAGLDPVGWAGMPVVDFLACVARKRAN